MENLEELSKQWKMQSASIPEIDLPALRARATERLSKQQQRMRRSAFFGTASLSMVIVVTSWILYSMPHRSWSFYAGIAGVDVIIVIYSSLMWYATLIGKEDVAMSNLDYLEDTLRRLRLRRLMATRLIIVYMILLNLSLTFYYMDILQNASTRFLLITYSITYAYSIATYFITKYRNRKRSADLDLLIAEMEQMRDAFRAA